MCRKKYSKDFFFDTLSQKRKITFFLNDNSQLEALWLHQIPVAGHPSVAHGNGVVLDITALKRRLLAADNQAGASTVRAVGLVGGEFVEAF